MTDDYPYNNFFGDIGGLPIRHQSSMGVEFEHRMDLDNKFPPYDISGDKMTEFEKARDEGASLISAIGGKHYYNAGANWAREWCDKTLEFRVQEKNDKLFDSWATVEDDNKKLKSIIAELMAALEYYADDERWRFNYFKTVWGADHAKEALKQARQKLDSTK